jgi:gas vesicle protein
MASSPTTTVVTKPKPSAAGGTSGITQPTAQDKAAFEAAKATAAKKQSGTPEANTAGNSGPGAASLPATGMPKPTEADSRRDAPTTSTPLISGQPVPAGYKGKTALVTLHGSMVPPNSRIQVSSFAPEVNETGWKGMTVHDNSMNDLASRTPGAIQFRVPTGPDGKWSGEVRILETSGSNGVIFIQNAGSRDASAVGLSSDKKIPTIVNDKKPKNLIIKVTDPATITPKLPTQAGATQAQQNAFLNNNAKGWQPMLSGDIRAATMFKSDGWQATHKGVLRSTLKAVPQSVLSMPETTAAQKAIKKQAVDIAQSTINTGGSVRNFLDNIMEAGRNARNTLINSVDSTQNNLYASTIGMLNPSFLPDDLGSLVSGGIDYAGKLRQNVRDIDGNIRKMYQTMKFLQDTTMPTENLDFIDDNAKALMTRVEQFYEGAATTMETVMGKHEAIRDAMKDQAKNAAIMSIIATVATLGSVGFLYSNGLAVLTQGANAIKAARGGSATPGTGGVAGTSVAGTSAAGAVAAPVAGQTSVSLFEKAKAYLTAPNLPAAGGSVTLATQNGNNIRVFQEQATDLNNALAGWSKGADGQPLALEAHQVASSIVKSQDRLTEAYGKFMSFLFKYTEHKEYQSLAALPAGVAVGQWIPAPAPADPTQDHAIGSIYSKHYRYEYSGRTSQRIEYYVKHTWMSQSEGPTATGPRGGAATTKWGRDWDV